MRANPIRSQRLEDLVVREVMIGILGCKTLAMRIRAAIGTARRALPLMLGAGPRIPHATGLVQPLRVREHLHE